MTRFPSHTFSSLFFDNQIGSVQTESNRMRNSFRIKFKIVVNRPHRTTASSVYFKSIKNRHVVLFDHIVIGTPKRAIRFGVASAKREFFILFFHDRLNCSSTCATIHLDALFFLRFCLSLFGTSNAYTLQTVVRSIHRMTDSVRTDDDDDDYSKFHWPLHTRYVVSFSSRITPLSFVFIRWTFNFTVRSLLSRCQWRREETNQMHSAGVMEWSRWLRSKVNKVTGRFDADDTMCGERKHIFFRILKWRPTHGDVISLGVRQW